MITDTTTDPDQPHKYVAFDDASVATLAVDDPTLYYDCPVDYTAQCGFDVLAHASEPYVSRLNFAPSLGNALYAIRLTAQHLREATWNPQELQGREGMMYAQYIAAQAFNSGGLGIIHSISHAVSAFYDTHHGLNSPGRGRGARSSDPAAPRRRHLRAVRRCEAGHVLQEPAGQGPDQVLRERPGDHRRRRRRGPDHQPRSR